MGKTYKHGSRWKKDRRDRNFKESKKFKDFKHGHQHNHKPNVESQVVEEEEEGYDDVGNNNTN